MELTDEKFKRTMINIFKEGEKGQAKWIKNTEFQQCCVFQTF